MTSAIHLATPQDAARLLPLIEAFHAEYGLATTPEHREAALMPLLEGSPLGAAWLFGPARAPTGYIIVSFGWSMELGGLDAIIDELYVRPPVRKRGIATDVLHTLTTSLTEVGVKALHLEADKSDTATQNLYRRAGFAARDRYTLMTRIL